ncbi:hypothetical protein MUK42_30143 [Musa troglodytarum]|uniref:Uncharacterized protein n=1 Tax=Musa troglodytarum TaxID=320322 RepID=A0A9E7HAZ3_9LILI|nr:hypothetical protein MUK42_34396 [Musa troglodytarum]URE36755.1 hypothetical protein MUK42_30143 [Musa troglodytarum]
MESSGWAGVSPRISFSHDLTQADISGGGDPRLDLSLPLDVSASSDFDFILGADISSHDSSLADDLFSDGKLLPLPIKNPPSSSAAASPSSLPSASAADPPAAPKPASARRRKRGSLREIMASCSEGGVGIGRPSPRRSSSLNCGDSRRGLCPFPLLRSKSSGSMPTNPSSTKHCTSFSSPFTELFRKGSKEPKARVYYYSGSSRLSHGNAVRISPIINVPTPSSMSIFSFLLCKHGDKNMAKSSAVTCYP